MSEGVECLTPGKNLGIGVEYVYNFRQVGVTGIKIKSGTIHEIDKET